MQLALVDVGRGAVHGVQHPVGHDRGAGDGEVGAAVGEHGARGPARVGRDPRRRAGERHPVPACRAGGPAYIGATRRGAPGGRSGPAASSALARRAAGASPAGRRAAREAARLAALPPRRTTRSCAAAGPTWPRSRRASGGRTTRPSARFRDAQGDGASAPILNLRGAERVRRPTCSERESCAALGLRSCRSSSTPAARRGARSS